MNGLRANLTTGAAAALLFVVMAIPARAEEAWGALSQRSIISTSVHLLSQQQEIPLLRLRQYVEEGSRASERELAELYPKADINAVGEIEREMFLLQAVRGDRIDPYFAYRLGTLGRLVADVSAPMMTSRPDIRKEYFEDVEKNIRGIQMQASSRMLVDPQAYFARVRRLASDQDDTIEVDYVSGLGFDGLAKLSLSADASRAVDAIADVWYTIFAQDVSRINISKYDISEYSLDALTYYLSHNKLSEAEGMRERVMSLGIMTPDLLKSIGDAYFDTGFFDRAMEQYKSVLDEEPGRRDVIVKIAMHYEVVGDEAVSENRLEDARAAYEAAAEADKLNADAQRKLRDIESKIFERDERLMDYRMAILAARDLETAAERARLDRDFATAIGQLRDARERYSSVTDEFAPEAKAAALGIKNVDMRIRELKGELIRNAQNLSGSGFARIARDAARAETGMAGRTLRDMLNGEYGGAMAALNQTLGQTLDVAP